MSSGILTLYIFLSERLYFHGLLYRRKFHDFRSRKIRNPCTFWAGETDPFNEFFSNLQLALEKSILSMNMWFSLSRAQNIFSKVVYRQGLWKKIIIQKLSKIFHSKKTFIKMKATIGYFNLPSTNTILPEVQNIKRNG